MAPSSISQLLVLAFSVVGTNAACNADNCYRALFPCPSPSAASVASAFCETITSGAITATNYPTRATAACGTTPDRYISACACGPTCSTTPTTTACNTQPTVGLVYGDFECGIAPWTPQVPDPAATVIVSSPGFTGNEALEVDFNPPSVTPEEGISARIISPPIPVTPGTEYLLNWYTWFNNLDAGFVGVIINDVPLWTVDARDHGDVAATWNDNQFPWTAGAGVTNATIVFEFDFLSSSDPPASVDKIDDITFIVA